MMKKKTITLSEKNLIELEEECKKLGIGLSELLRRIIDEYFKK